MPRSEKVEGIGVPFTSFAGLNRPLRLARLHVVLSRSALPLDDVTVQPDTRPSAPTWTLTDTRPWAPARLAAAGYESCGNQLAWLPRGDTGVAILGGAGGAGGATGAGGAGGDIGGGSGFGGAAYVLFGGGISSLIGGAVT